MLSKTEKMLKCEEYIRNTFGMDAFRTLYLFEENVTSLFSLIDIYGSIIADTKNMNSFTKHLLDTEFLELDNFLV